MRKTPEFATRLGVIHESETRMTSTCVYLPGYWLVALRRLAAQTRQPMASLLRDAIEEYLNKNLKH
jgi:predicted DNA-binding protein